MSNRCLPAAILEFLADRQTHAPDGAASPAEITAGVRMPRATINRHLRALVASGQIFREGTGPATLYRYRDPLPALTVTLSPRQALKALLQELLDMRCQHDLPLDQPCADCAVSFLAQDGERAVILKGGVSQSMASLRALLQRRRTSA